MESLDSIQSDPTIQTHLVVWELKRPHACDGRVVEASKAVSFALACNSNAQILGGEVGVLALAQYVVGYCAKNPVQLGGVLSVLRHVMREVEERLGHKLQATDEYAALLKRVVNAMDRKIEVGAQMAATAVLGFPSWHASHKFVVINPWHYVSALGSLFPMPCGDPHDPL